MKEQIMQPGLYNKDNKLILSWDLLEKENFNVQYNYPTTPSLSQYRALRDILYSHNIMFQDCKLVIPENIEEIGNYAFGSCSALKEIVLPKNLEYLGEGVFYRCTSLEILNWPNQLTTIPNYTFFNTSIKSFDLNNIVVIGQNAFTGCFFLKVENVPKTIKKIGREAFKACTHLAKFKFSGNLVCVDNATFQSTGLTNIIIEEGIEYINSFAFLDSDELENVKLPNTLKVINKEAFAGTNIKEIIIPENVEFIDIEAFDNCENLKNMFISKKVLDKNLPFRRKYADKIIQIENSLDRLLISGKTFKEANNLLLDNTNLYK